MKFVKKFFIVTVFLFAMIALVACGGKSQPKTTLIVGTPGLSGDFIAGFGSSSYDVNVRDLVHGYGTLVETETGEFVWDTKAVLKKEPTASVDAEGNKTYKFELQEDLKWNNGNGITAEDFVLYLLLRSSKDWKEGTKATSANAGYYILGFAEYSAAETVLNVPFKGIRLTGKFTFELTIDAEQLPYYYESTMVATSPIDVETYLPGFQVKDDGKGAYIANKDSKTTIAETLAKTVADTATGQRFKPTVTCGPYQFVDFSNDVVTVKLNPNFKMNYEGKKPSIDQIQIKKINQVTDVDQVIAGAVDIVAGVVEGAKIEAAKAAPTAGVVSYARNGYGMIAFHTDFGPTAEVEVRQAIGYIIDRNEFLTQILGGYGTLVNGPFGEAMWFYKETKAELEGKLINYTFNIDKANELLDKSTYKYEADGVTPFDPKKATKDNGYFRYNAQKQVLEYNHMGGAENEVTTLINTQLVANAWQVGIKASVTEADWSTLQSNYYYGPTLGNERKYHSFNLATGFYSNYDPYWSWHSSLAGTTNNPTQLQDQDLDEIMVEMQKVEPGDKDTFKELFVEFAIRWNQLLPTLPIYSNEYFDVYNVRVKGLKTAPVWSWSKDICDLTIETKK